MEEHSSITLSKCSFVDIIYGNVKERILHNYVVMANIEHCTVHKEASDYGYWRAEKLTFKMYVALSDTICMAVNKIDRLIQVSHSSGALVAEIKLKLLCCVMLLGGLHYEADSYSLLILQQHIH